VAAIEVDSYVQRAPEEVRELLLNVEFLEAFVEKQHATTRTVDVERDAGVSTAVWTVQLPEDVPGMVKQLVGRELAMTLRITLGKETLDQGKSLDLDAVGKKTGKMRSRLSLDPEGDGTRVRVAGTVDVAAGLFSGPASDLARDQVVTPVLREDLFRLLQEWPTAG